MISDLPQDLIEEILSRVPVTSLRRLRSTCKRWYHEALFKDARFIKKHFDKTPRQYHDLIYMNYRVYTMSSVLDRYPKHAGVALGIVSPTHPACSHKLLDVSRAFHCDDILLCTDHLIKMLVVWNPFSGQTRWIQVPQTRCYGVEYALGYDNSELCRNYKIARFPCKYRRTGWKELDVTPEGDLKLEIYEFSTNSWRNLDAITPEAYFRDDGVSLKGNTYWVSYNQQGGGDYSLLSFDFSTERFQHLCAPFHHKPSHSDHMVLSVSGEEHLSLLYQSKETRKVEIWMTDEIETTFVSWSKFLTVDLNHFFSKFMSFLIIDKEKKVALCCYKEDPDNAFILWIVHGEEEYRATPSILVQRGIHKWRLLCSSCHVPRLFGHVPKLAL